MSVEKDETVGGGVMEGRGHRGETRHPGVTVESVAAPVSAAAQGRSGRGKAKGRARGSAGLAIPRHFTEAGVDPFDQVHLDLFWSRPTANQACESPLINRTHYDQ